MLDVECTLHSTHRIVTFRGMFDAKLIVWFLTVRKYIAVFGLAFYTIVITIIACNVYKMHFKVYSYKHIATVEFIINWSLLISDIFIL